MLEGFEAEIPEAMIENRSNESVREFDYRLRSQGMDLETYLKYTGTTVEDFKATFRPQAEAQVKFRLALEKIVELEKIVAEEKDIEEQFEKMAKDYGMEIDKIKAAVPAEEIAKDLAVGKAIDFIKENAVITEVEEKAVLDAAREAEVIANNANRILTNLCKGGVAESGCGNCIRESGYRQPDGQLCRKRFRRCWEHSPGG